VQAPARKRGSRCGRIRHSRRPDRACSRSGGAERRSAIGGAAYCRRLRRQASAVLHRHQGEAERWAFGPCRLSNWTNRRRAPVLGALVLGQHRSHLRGDDVTTATTRRAVVSPSPVSLLPRVKSSDTAPTTFAPPVLIARAPSGERFTARTTIDTDLTNPSPLPSSDSGEGNERRAANVGTDAGTALLKNSA